MQSRQGWVQGYNAQTVVNDNHIIIAAEVSVTAADSAFDPMIRAAERELQAIGLNDRPGMVVADAGYWNQRQMEKVIGRGMQVIIPPDSRRAKASDPAGTAGSTRSCAV